MLISNITNLIIAKLKVPECTEQNAALYATGIFENYKT